MRTRLIFPGYSRAWEVQFLELLSVAAKRTSNWVNQTLPYAGLAVALMIFLFIGLYAGAGIQQDPVRQATPPGPRTPTELIPPPAAAKAVT
jgi:hypothetical protein